MNTIHRKFVYLKKQKIRDRVNQTSDMVFNTTLKALIAFLLKNKNTQSKCIENNEQIISIIFQNDL